MLLPFADRTEAGRLLGEALLDYRGRMDLLVLALPRGGVPVAAEVARLLEAPLDLMLVRKLGVPIQPELAMGAIATGGARVLNSEIIRALLVTQQQLDRITEMERHELERREQLYRGRRPPPELTGRCVILVDDGLATGASMRVAVQAAAMQGPAELVVAAPVASLEAVQLVGEQANQIEVVALATPEPFIGVGYWYEAFTQTTDAEVRTLLEQAWQGEKRQR
ncbi:phosphoribosyltransferase [Lamprobacter modestohalophilus]|uniref:Phosphoribosyltransferase n=1 Tax=Lamprobacter modestohalophilus TaxID=1064514 RepID=A0A9X1B4D1_9GAMM|nr:phosphoribosyltransferase [Lamprobacter modestohalophilus]MCF7978669.1 phosphoribosyltransferase [Chromatiaceae bacterium]MBK1619348.1 phosphoribosyltransferase [Lamprobacter modestohalophilus]MCF7993364.1 phosphoribosyltransferase [Chromatiaceae bacterium]MCF8002823.1 phosphoribosyltransferase [Chromatiaceae bacterium]MCF8015683.1 phosphoribosyltransferase [Chromatiaceae bacterium]